jgi:tRNA(Ile)-lysidine synthase
MIHRSDTVVVGFSGGPDSTALLRALAALRSEFCFRIVAAHLDHGLRNESHEDARFAGTAAERMGVPVRIGARDVAFAARSWGVGVEEAGRRARREFLEETRILFNAQSIALAHHADDQIETFFLRVFRGSSLSGIGGMAPVFGRFIRPLLSTTKEEILAYLEEAGVPYLVDRTNLESDTERNFIRNRLLPLIKERFMGFEGPLLRTMELVREEDAFLDELSASALQEELLPAPNEVVLRVPFLKSLHPVLRRRVIRRAVYRAGGPYVRLGRVHIEAIESIALGDKNPAETQAPGGVVARRSGAALFIHVGVNRSRGVVAHTRPND